MNVIKTVEDFEEGDINCVKCGKSLTLNYNGGELDREFCCGLVYETFSRGTDLYVYEDVIER